MKTRHLLTIRLDVVKLYYLKSVKLLVSFSVSEIYSHHVCTDLILNTLLGVTNLLSQLNLLNSQNAIPQSSYIFKVIQKFNILNNDPALPPPEPGRS